MKKFISIVMTILFTFNSSSFAAVVNDSRQAEMEKTLFMAVGSQDRILRIGLVDCILYCMKNNSEILIKRIEPKLKQDDVKVAESDFEPTFDADFTLQDTTEISTSTLQGARKFNSQDININAGVSGKLITGTEYNLEFLNQRYKSDSVYQIYNPYYSSEPKITITQPLFKGFGILVNKADIMIARNDQMVSEKNFRDTVMDTISKAKTAYYNYTFYLEKYSIDGLSLQRANNLLEVNKARYEKGLISSVDLLETEAASAEREKALLSSEAALKRAEDDLKLITNLVDDPEVWNAKIELIDELELRQEDVDLLKSLQDAFIYRPDYQAARVDLQNRDIKIKVAKNALLPTVDLTGSLGLNGLGKDYQSAMEKVNSNYPDWGVGVKFSLPWGTGDRAKYDQKKLEKTQALLSFKRLEQNIILDVRDKVRLAKTQYRQIEVAKLSKDKETQNYEAQKERYAAGQVSTHDILDYQDKLAQSELDYFKALVDYNVALIDLDKSQGLTLVKNNIKIEG
ncbi:MAG: TolC family protein [Candidatus Omnitrophica bacterium]|nr:TolC family protein [Candidatus Omnitrophota bacterium]MBU1923492.1 TolC family protein [Candidatus Omnitrophota bacterium]